MYGMNYSGGDNKTHGQIERVLRIDSFEAGRVAGRGTVLARGEGRVLPFRCTCCGPSAELSCLGSHWRGTLELARVRSAFGGSRAFWLCPICGRRARFLYRKDRRFVCRECAKLNYQSQQRTKDSINHFRDGLKLAREKLSWEPPGYIAPMDFPRLLPDRPKGMHEATYQRHLARFRQYQENYRKEVLREMLAILRR